MASKPTVNMDSASSQSESHTESSYSHDSSHVSQQSSSTQNAPSNRNYLNYLSALFVWPPLVEGPLYGMSEEQHAIMLKKAECKLPTTPPPNTKDEDVQDVTSPSISPKPFRFSGFTSNDTGSGSLCQLHILEDNAFFAVDSPEIRKIQDNFLSGDYEQLPSLMKTSLAAVALRIGIPGQPHASRVSGFRLGRDTIITCAHFVTWPETEQGFMDAARMFHSGMNGVNEALQVREITTPTAALRNRFKIRLSAVLVDQDIAVFHILERPRTDHWNPVVDPSQMVFTAEHSRAELRKTQLCWSVGYNISVNQEEFNDTWSDFFQRQSSEKQSDIVLAHGYTEDRPPSLEELKPSRRTVAFGKFRENPDEHGLKLEPHQEYIDHTAWHGRSGGMVCVYDGGNKKAWVCGIVIGGFRVHDFNHMNVFTSDVEEWMARAISFQDVTSTPAEFGRRFIRSL